MTPSTSDHVGSLARLVHPRHDAGGGRGAAPRLGFGGDWNPEQWSRATWAEDAELMVEAGITFVTVGVFAWAQVQPRAGVFELEWLDEVVALMDRHGIGVDLATATASPPAWLVRAHPEVLPVDRHGHRLDFGGRQAWCPSSPVFREHALALVDNLAQHYAGHPALAMWHVSNELGCHNVHCYCDVSAEAFRDWLQHRYGDVEALNAAWGTTFWSQRYDAWSEVGVPRAVTAIPNPTQEQDFRRFGSDALLAHHRAEHDAIRRHDATTPITTNFMVSRHVDGLDYWSWAPAVDVVSNDHYLDGSIRAPHVELALCADWTRGLAGGRPWVLMEHSTSAVNWQPVNHAKPAGQMRRNTLQHVARGADSAGFFQWRASRAGAERFHSAMLPHAGTGTRVWRETVELGALLGRLAEVAGTTVHADVALVLDWQSWWALEGPALPRDDLHYPDLVREWYQPLWDLGVTVDVLPPGADLSAYRVLLAPLLHVLPDDAAASLAAYVEGGGHLLLGWFSGVVDEDLHLRLGGHPGGLGDVLGLTVEEVLPADDDVALTGRWEGSAHTWTEHVRLRPDAEVDVVLEQAGGPWAGVPVLTRHASGAGAAWYCAARTDALTTAALVREVLDDAGVPVPGTHPGVELVRRRGAGTSYLFALNHTDTDVEVSATGTDLISGEEVRGTLVLVAGDVACVREGG